MFNRNLLMCLAIMPVTDFILIKMFNNKARWFQLHAVINFIITYLIFPDVYKLFVNPVLPLQKRNEYSDLSILLVCTLHIYHFIIENLSLIELKHHVLFVAFGTLPVFIYWDNIVVTIFLFAGCGLPGAIEYTMLSLVRNKYLDSLKQKEINSFINNYIRCPISIYGSSLAYISRINMNPPVPLFLYYFIFLVYINGTFFSKMAIENHIWHMCNTRQ
jgi:hypothetical protein